MKQTSSAAHIYGRLAGTGRSLHIHGHLRFYRGAVKPKSIGDCVFCDGTQNMLVNVWYTQAQPDALPGWCCRHCCPAFNYKQTWWPLADGWLTYLARCQYLLRQGVFVADFAVLRSEKIPDYPDYDYWPMALRRGERPLKAKKMGGFDYDWINADALLQRASAKDGRLLLPDGMSYRYLLLPDGFLSEATLKKINELAEAGVPVIAPTTCAGLGGKVRAGDWQKPSPQTV